MGSFIQDATDAVNNFNSGVSSDVTDLKSLAAAAGISTNAPAPATPVAPRPPSSLGGMSSTTLLLVALVVAVVIWKKL